MSDNYLQNTILSIESELSSPRASAGKLNIILHTIRIQEKVQERIVARNYKCCGRFTQLNLASKPAGKLNTGMASPGKSPLILPPWLRTELGDIALSLGGLWIVLRLLFGSYSVLELLVLGWRLWLLVAVRHPDRSKSRGVERFQGPRRLSQVQPQTSGSRGSTSGCSGRGDGTDAVGCVVGEGCSWRGASTNAVG